MSTKGAKPTATESNPIVSAAASKVRKRQKVPTSAPTPGPDQLPLFPLNDLTPKANR